MRERNPIGSKREGMERGPGLWSRSSARLREEEGQALSEQAILLAALLGIGALSSYPLAKRLLASLGEHLDWITAVVEAPLP